TGEHCVARPAAARSVIRTDRLGDLLRLGGVGGVAPDGGNVTVVAGGPQGRRAAQATTEYCVGDGQNLWRRAVIVAEPHQSRAWELLAEAVEIPGIGAVPGVDGLVGVADDAEVGAVAHPGLEERVLG